MKNIAASQFDTLFNACGFCGIHSFDGGDMNFTGSPMSQMRDKKRFDSLTADWKLEEKAKAMDLIDNQGMSVDAAIAKIATERKLIKSQGGTNTGTSNSITSKKTDTNTTDSSDNKDEASDGMFSSMSTGAKIGIAIGGVVLLTGTAYLIFRKKAA